MNDPTRPQRPGTVFEPPARGVGDRNESNRSKPFGVPIIPAVPVEFIDSEQPGTGVVEGDALKKVRRGRSTENRLDRLEDKSDEDRAAISEFGERLGRIEGKLEVLPQLVQAVKESSDRVIQREQLTFTRDVEVDKAQKLGTIRLKLIRGEWVTKLLAVVGTSAAIVLALIEARRC